jgi:adenosine kinase
MNNHSARVLISGSIAFDTIMVFDGHFKDHILPERVHMLSVSFLTPRLKREFGGTAANIAFNLAMLGGAPVPLAAVGHDGREYVQRLAAAGIDVGSIIQLPDQFTAQAFITTDLADNQIIAFHPGAMNEAHQVQVGQAGAAAWGIVAPNGKAAMLQHAAQFKAAGIPFIFDPGQGLPMFEGAELRALLDQASALTVNDYESRMLSDKSGWSEAEIARRVRHVVITRGSEGSTLYVDARGEQIDAVPVSQAVDPTGCGDAYRGGLLFGLASGLPWPVSARLGSVLGAVKIECAGAQNHSFTRQSVAERYARAYGPAPW